MKSAILAAAVALAALSSSPVLAQQAAAPVNHGAPIQGVCFYSPQRVLTQSTAGASLATGLQRLAEEVRGELQPYATAIETEQTALAGIQQAGQQIDQARLQAYQQRLQEAAQLEQTRQNELRYTELFNTEAIGRAAQPQIIAAYQAKGCSLLINRSAVLMGNPDMDITETVLQGVNRDLPSLSVTRLAVPAQAQQ